ncbi:MAG: hypothetical protein ACXVIY_00970 [Mucilaginibacter sp.]
MSEIDEFKDADHPTNPAPAPTPVSRRVPFPKVENPKDQQFTGRATYEEAIEIDEAIAAAKKKYPGRDIDIVRYVLMCIEYIESDILQTFPTRVKGYEPTRERKPR